MSPVAAPTASFPCTTSATIARLGGSSAPAKNVVATTAMKVTTMPGLRRERHGEPHDQHSVLAPSCHRSRPGWIAKRLREADGCSEIGRQSKRRAVHIMRSATYRAPTTTATTVRFIAAMARSAGSSPPCRARVPARQPSGIAAGRPRPERLEWTTAAASARAAGGGDEPHIVPAGGGDRRREQVAHHAQAGAGAGARGAVRAPTAPPGACRSASPRHPRRRTMPWMKRPPATTHRNQAAAGTSLRARKKAPRWRAFSAPPRMASPIRIDVAQPPARRHRSQACLRIAQPVVLPAEGVTDRDQRDPHESPGDECHQHPRRSHRRHRRQALPRRPGPRRRRDRRARISTGSPPSA